MQEMNAYKRTKSLTSAGANAPGTMFLSLSLGTR